MQKSLLTGTALGGVLLFLIELNTTPAHAIEQDTRDIRCMYHFIPYTTVPFDQSCPPAPSHVHITHEKDHNGIPKEHSGPECIIEMPINNIHP